MKKLFAILLVLMLAVSGLAMAEEDTSVENILEKPGRSDRRNDPHYVLQWVPYQ